jgi:hypothetical protein
MCSTNVYPHARELMLGGNYFLGGRKTEVFEFSDELLDGKKS